LGLPCFIKRIQGFTCHALAAWLVLLLFELRAETWLLSLSRVSSLLLSQSQWLRIQLATMERPCRSDSR